ncbi:hypothetical protein P3T76_002727 [Phytophthora citrophthora]|uniref:Uncharacterized protein n=1 Tax=Phytophthora citrophthora TaxID=4793 RepID=A0AAD9GW53_9STRA|nr:hypothetical protein P3T76_002727 [Phytophthora citrophthora]
MLDGNWLRDDSAAARDLIDGKIHDDIKAMIADSKILRPAWRIRDELSAEKTRWNWLLKWLTITPKIKTKQIHVLVKVPDMMMVLCPCVLLLLKLNGVYGSRSSKYLQERILELRLSCIEHEESRI